MRIQKHVEQTAQLDNRIDHIAGKLSSLEASLAESLTGLKLDMEAVKKSMGVGMGDSPPVAGVRSPIRSPSDTAYWPIES